MAKGSLEISTYSPPAAVSPPPARTDSRVGHRESPTTVNLLAATASLALHVLMLTSVIWAGGVSRARQVDVKSSEGLSGETIGGSAMQWVSLEETPRAGPSDRDNGNNIRARAFSDSPLRSVTL